MKQMQKPLLATALKRQFMMNMSMFGRHKGVIFQMRHISPKLLRNQFEISIRKRRKRRIPMNFTEISLQNFDKRMNKQRRRRRVFCFRLKRLRLKYLMRTRNMRSLSKFMSKLNFRNRFL